LQVAELRSPSVLNWRRNLFAVTAASFIGFTGFTLVMPFLPLYLQQLGVSDVGEIALWSGLSLGVTPAVTALMAPLWGRLADRVGRKIMVERSLVSFVVVMAAMGFVTKAWHVFALRAVQGLFAGYGALTLTMAADSAPRERMAQAIGIVQTAQRLGPALGPVIGGIVAQIVGLRRAFLVTSAFYLAAVIIVFVMYHERRPVVDTAARGTERVTFRNVLAFENFILLMAVVFGLQFVDRSFGPILPLYITELGTAADAVPIVSGVLFSLAAGAAALGNHISAALLRAASARVVIAAAAAGAATGTLIYVLAGHLLILMVGTAIFGVAIGTATTAAYTAASAVIPGSARGAGFGLLTTASLTGLAISPIASGLLSALSIRAVFLIDTIALVVLAALVRRLMVVSPLTPTTPPAAEEL
jgi:DHA1 family multidrug resistance protein-like MFS transporter